MLSTRIASQRLQHPWHRKWFTKSIFNRILINPSEDASSGIHTNQSILEAIILRLAQPKKFFTYGKYCIVYSSCHIIIIFNLISLKYTQFQFLNYKYHCDTMTKLIGTFVKSGQCYQLDLFRKCYNIPQTVYCSQIQSFTEYW